MNPYDFRPSLYWATLDLVDRFGSGGVAQYAYDALRGNPEAYNAFTTTILSGVAGVMNAAERTRL